MPSGWSFCGKDLYCSIEQTARIGLRPYALVLLRSLLPPPGLARLLGGLFLQGLAQHLQDG